MEKQISLKPVVTAFTFLVLTSNRNKENNRVVTGIAEFESHGVGVFRVQRVGVGILYPTPTSDVQFFFRKHYFFGTKPKNP